jgi:hypothetical protein
LDKLASNSVNSAKIVDASIVTADLADNSVTSAKIVNGTVAADDLADGAVTAAKLNKMNATANQALVYNGSAWVPTALSSSAYSGGAAPCTGAVVYGGAYNSSGLGVYDEGFENIFDSNWSSPEFSIQGRDLCWAKTDISGTKTWEDARTACAALTTDSRRWRLPNLKELLVLYEAIGGTTTALTALDTYGYGAANGASAMQAAYYWSSTERTAGTAYRLTFDYGHRSFISKETTDYVRCVRSL